MAYRGSLQSSMTIRFKQLLCKSRTTRLSEFTSCAIRTSCVIWVVVPFTDEQGSEIVENGKIKATWFVVPGSGTGDLSGLRGEGGFEGQFGKGSDGMLNYWFE